MIRTAQANPTEVRLEVEPVAEDHFADQVIGGTGQTNA
jgi:hypothetical protein